MASAKESIAKRIVDDVHEDVDVELWHTADGQGYLSTKNGSDEHFEHYLLKDKRTKQWLAARYYAKTRDVVSSSVLSNVINILEGFAQEGPTYETYIRIGGKDGAIYIDLGDTSWKAVVITAMGWNVIQNPPVKFQRTNSMLPLPEPVSGGSLDEDLRPLLTVDSDDSWLLIKGWLLGLLLPKGPHPIMAFRGEQDTAKSYTQKLLRAIVDPSVLPIRRPAKKVEDLMIAARNNWVVSFDNMSKIGDDLSDDLCCVATGGGIAKRALWTDTNETILRVCNPIIMNGIGNIITKPDLLDRSIYITLFPIPPTRRRAEGDLIHEFEEKLPKILGALLDASVIALQKQGEIVLNDPYRMAGFVKFAAAGLGGKGDAFQAAYKNNRDYAIKEAIADDVLVNWLMKFIPQFHRSSGFMNPGQEPCWKGNATDLLTLLKRDLEDTHAAQIPGGAGALSFKLRTLAPALRKVGIKVEKDKARTWKIGVMNPE